MSFGSLPSVLGNGGGVAISVIGGTGLFADGTAAAPSISFAADTGTGLYRQNTNVIGVALAGAAAGRFEGDGASGIRFRHPTGNYLGLNNSGAIEIIAAGTNQSITLTPSGNGLSTCYNNARATQLAVGSSVNGVYSIGRDNIATGYFQLRDNSSNVLFSVTPTTGRFLLGTTTDSGALLQIGTNTTTAAGGMVFGTDTNLFRFLPGILRIAYSQAASTGLSSWNQNVAGYAVNNFTTDSDNFDFGVGGSAAGLSALRRCFYIYDNTASAALLTIAQSTGNTVFAGTIKPQQAGTAPTYVKGAIYFDTTLNKLRVGGATAWETITSV